MSLKKFWVILILIAVLLGLVVYVFYPVFSGWKMGKWKYDRGEREEYTLGVWRPDKGLMTLIDQYRQVKVINFGSLRMELTAYKKRLGISWSKKIDILCPDDRVMVIGDKGLDGFDKIISFGGGKCDGGK